MILPGDAHGALPGISPVFARVEKDSFRTCIMASADVPRRPKHYTPVPWENSSQYLIISLLKKGLLVLAYAHICADIDLSVSRGISEDFRWLIEALATMRIVFDVHTSWCLFDGNYCSEKTVLQQRDKSEPPVVPSLLLGSKGC
jgi:hypothetical protein